LAFRQERREREKERKRERESELILTDNFDSFQRRKKSEKDVAEGEKE